MYEGVNVCVGLAEMNVPVVQDIFASMQEPYSAKFTNLGRSATQQPQWSSVNNLFPLVALCVYAGVCIHV